MDGVFMRVPERTFGTKREVVTRGWRNFIVTKFVICALYQILLGVGVAQSL
jgi:hypothetical protein